MLKTGAVSSVVKVKASMSLVFAFALAKLAKKKLALLNIVLLLKPITSVGRKLTFDLALPTADDVVMIDLMPKHLKILQHQ
jgi:hypothetical protein